MSVTNGSDEYQVVSDEPPNGLPVVSGFHIFGTSSLSINSGQYSSPSHKLSPSVSRFQGSVPIEYSKGVGSPSPSGSAQFPAQSVVIGSQGSAIPSPSWSDVVTST